MDGLLETYHWHGRCFERSEDVHPLDFSTLRHGIANVNHGGSYLPNTIALFHSIPVLGSVAHDNLSGEVERNS